jgi:serine/threonine protein kinase
MSPELINSKSDNPKVDIWAFGGCVIEMLTGNPPYSDQFKDIRLVMINIAKGIKPNFPQNINSLTYTFL